MKKNNKKVLSEEEKKEIKRKTKKQAFTFFKRLFFIILIVVGLFNYVFGIYRINDNSMYPSFHDGDLVLTYKLAEPEPTDVIAYVDNNTKTIRFGRVVGVSGDEIGIYENNYFTINGNIPYEQIYYPTTQKGNTVTYPYTVDKDEVFVMGDMRQQAIDSRDFGGISLSDVRGKIILLFLRGRNF